MELPGWAWGMVAPSGRAINWVSLALICSALIVQLLTRQAGLAVDGVLLVLGVGLGATVGKAAGVEEGRSAGGEVGVADGRLAAGGEVGVSEGRRLGVAEQARLSERISKKAVSKKGRDMGNFLLWSTIF